ncbi:type II toxin-antitoxin system HicB family antitoxin [soil metagenome]
MIKEYISAAMKEARYEILEDASFYGEIEGLKGVWANADKLEETREELEEVLEEWIVLRLSRNLSIPSIGGVTLSAPSVA